MKEVSSSEGPLLFYASCASPLPVAVYQARHTRLYNPHDLSAGDCCSSCPCWNTCDTKPDAQFPPPKSQKREEKEWASNNRPRFISQHRRLSFAHLLIHARCCDEADSQAYTIRSSYTSNTMNIILYHIRKCHVDDIWQTLNINPCTDRVC